jgi:hypothetical protein
MSNYHSRVHAHELEPMIDRRALFVLSTFLSLGICAAMVVLF